MKRTSYLVLALVTMGLEPLYCQDTAPNIVFTGGLSKDFGKVTAGKPLIHTFQFTNNGQGTLEIVQIRPT